MNSLRNKVQLIGNLGQDPELKEVKGGKKMTKLTIATNESYKNAAGEKVEETQWHNLVIWGKQAETAAKYLRKGSEIAVEGRLSNRNWTDKDGNKKYFTDIVVSDFLMLGGKKS